MRNKSNIILIIAVGLVVFAVCAIFFANIIKIGKTSGYVDFKVYYYAAKIFLRGENPYAPKAIANELEKNHQPLGATRFFYPMFFAVAFSPLALLKVKIAAKIWLLANLLLLEACLLILNKITTKRISALFLAASIIMFAMYWPIRYNFSLGQINIVIFLLMLLALFFAINKDRKYFSCLSGVSLGLAALIKIFPVAFIFYFLLKKRYKIVACAIVSMVLITIGTGLIAGFDREKQFYTEKLPKVMNLSATSNISLTAFTKDIFKKNKIKTNPIIMFNIALASVSLFWIWKRKKDIKEVIILEYSFVLILILLISENVHKHYLIWCLLPLSYLLFAYAAEKKYTALGFGLLSYFFLCLPPMKIDFSYNFFGLLILFVLLAYALHKKYYCLK